MKLLQAFLQKWQSQDFFVRCLLILLVAVMLLGGLARFYRLDEKGLWSDEIATIATSLGNSIDPDAYRLRHETFDASKPVPAAWYKQKAFDASRLQDLGSTANVLKANVHPPLFFTLMHVWLLNGDIGVARLRFPAALFGVLSLLLMSGVAYRLTQWEPGWSKLQKWGFIVLSVTLMAFSAYQIDHAQDARPYTLLLCFALLAVFQTLKMIQNMAAKQTVSVWDWVGLSMILAAGLYTQYFFSVFAGFTVLTLCWTGRRNPRFLLQLGGSVLLVALLLLPWWPYFQVQLGFLKQAGHYTAGLWNPWRLPEKLWRVGCEFFLPYSKVGKLIPLLVLGSALSVWLSQKPWRRPNWSSLLGFILAWLLILIGGQLGLDIIKNTHTATIRRYLLLVSPACSLLLSYALLAIARQAWGKLLSAVLATVLLVLMLADSGFLLFGRHHSSDEFKQAAAWINPNYQGQDLVLVNKSGAMTVGLATYLKPGAMMQGLDVPSVEFLADNAPLIQGLKHSVSDKSRVWLALSHHAPSTERRLSEWLVAQGFSQQTMRKFPGVNVFLWSRK